MEHPLGPLEAPGTHLVHMQANALKIKTKPENRRFHLGLSLDNDHRLMPGQQHHCGKVGVAAATAFTRARGNPVPLCG